MDNLYLHIGGFKCGSSYIQSCLRLSRERLESEGFLYPSLSDAHEKPYSYTRGNGYKILESESTFNRLIRDHQNRGLNSLVFSNENLCVDLMYPETERVLLETADHLRIRKIKILFLIRNPIEYTISVWAQDIKNGIILDFEEFLNKHHNHYAVFLTHSTRFVERLHSNPKIELMVMNYSVCRTDLVKVVSEWLGLPYETLLRPGLDPVNRSLDFNEAKLQLELNKVVGERGFFLGRAFTEKLTGIHPVKEVPSHETQWKIWEEARPFAEKMNRFLPEGHQIVFDLQEPYMHSEDRYTFNSDQMRVIAEAVGEEMDRLASESKRLNDELERVNSVLNAVYASETTLKRFIRRISSRLRSMNRISR